MTAAQPVYASVEQRCGRRRTAKGNPRTETKPRTPPETESFPAKPRCRDQAADAARGGEHSCQAKDFGTVTGFARKAPEAKCAGCALEPRSNAASGSGDDSKRFKKEAGRNREGGIRSALLPMGGGRFGLNRILSHWAGPGNGNQITFWLHETGGPGTEVRARPYGDVEQSLNEYR